MSEKTLISWCDSTFSPWWGCKRVSEACRFCYASRDATRYGMGDLWTTDNRRTFTQKHWDQPLKWNDKARREDIRRSVFCGSMCDVLEDNPTVNIEREKLWPLIEKTPYLLWLLLTKRPENIKRFVPEFFYTRSNVAIGITAEDQENMDRRWPTLINSWEGLNFVSVEPMLGEVHLPSNAYYAMDWCIVGSESGSLRRPTDIEWIRIIRDECKKSGVLFFLKQMDIDGVLTKQPVLDGEQWLQTLLNKRTTL